MARFGIEEEFMVLDRRTLAPISRGAEARDALRRESPLPAGEAGGESEDEFLDCQVEISTTPSRSLREAGLQLGHFRRALDTFASETDTVICSAGTPFGSLRATAVTRQERYRVIADQMGGLSREHVVNGLHVHTEVPDLEERIRALNGIRPWLPVLLAMTANSPFWRRRRTGFASWRSILLRRMSTMGCPPLFADADDYERRVDRLVQTGATVDRAAIGWAARVSQKYPTVEVRIFDAQLSVDDALYAAALTRALISEPPAAEPLDAEAIDASFWIAAREGMCARLVDPRTGEVAPAWSVAEDLLGELRNSLDARGDLEFVSARLETIRAHGTGAERQLRALTQQGLPGLRALLLASQSALPPVTGRTAPET